MGYAIALYDGLSLVESVTADGTDDVDALAEVLSAYGQADVRIIELDAAGLEDEWHVEVTYDNGPASVSEVMKKRVAVEHAELFNTSPHVSVVVVRRCRGDWCYDCIRASKAFETCAKSVQS